MSLIDKEGMPFDDPEARAALFDELERHFEPSATREIVRVAADINDPAFSAAAVAAFRKMMGQAAPASSAAGGGGGGGGAAGGHGGGKAGAGAAGRRGLRTSAAAAAAAAPSVRLPEAGEGPRDQVLATLRALVASGQPIIGAG